MWLDELRQAKHLGQQLVHGQFCALAIRIAGDVQWVVSCPSLGGDLTPVVISETTGMGGHPKRV